MMLVKNECKFARNGITLFSLSRFSPIVGLIGEKGGNIRRYSRSRVIFFARRSIIRPLGSALIDPEFATLCARAETSITL